MKTSFFQLNARAVLCAVACGVIPFAASAQTYTFKIGAGRIDPRATSSDLEGTLPAANPLRATYGLGVPTGLQMEVQPKSTLLFSIERAFNDHWGVELVLGVPPKHDVKLRINDASKLAPAGYGALSSIPTASYGLFATTNNQVVATVKEVAPTVFFNYKFGEATSALRPYVGVGVNYTHFKADATQTGTNFYTDGPVKIELTDSFGLAFQTGVNYKFDKNWLLSAGWSTAAVKNNMTISTNTSRQTASYRFHPSVFSLMVGYSY
ncbi:OmpW family protein [Aquabacterium sp. NJ1]|uniref:OmpW/AlkL family protein n=1 Tax=Aquabacterium sp. NJ1 TaxID=1538295 RepID=UPI00068E0228|nr:OmpW family outer membrane protein [Aquabacterium sp. NJ1]